MDIEDLRIYTIFFVLISGILGIYYRDKLSDIKTKLFSVSVWFSFFTELIGINYYHFFSGSNYFIYNLYFLILFIIYFFCYANAVKNKNLIYLLCSLYVLFYVIDGSYLSDFYNEMLFNSYSFGVLLIAISAFLYLFELFNSPEIINYSRSITFWFTMGILAFHVPFVPFMYVLKYFVDLKNLDILSIVTFFLNLVMNFCFSFGFIWSKKIYNY